MTWFSRRSKTPESHQVRPTNIDSERTETWACSCGAWGLHLDSAVRHKQFIRDLSDLNTEPTSLDTYDDEYIPDVGCGGRV